MEQDKVTTLLEGILSKLSRGVQGVDETTTRESRVNGFHCTFKRSLKSPFQKPSRLFSDDKRVSHPVNALHPPTAYKVPITCDHSSSPKRFLSLYFFLDCKHFPSSIIYLSPFYFLLLIFTSEDKSLRPAAVVE